MIPRLQGVGSCALGMNLRFFFTLDTCQGNEKREEHADEGKQGQ